MTCGGHFPPLRLADFPVASTASSTTSRGTQDASTPREIQSLKRVPATSTVCVITRDHAHNQPERPGATRRADQDQLKLSGIGHRPAVLSLQRREQAPEVPLGVGTGISTVEQRIDQLADII